MSQATTIATLTALFSSLTLLVFALVLWRRTSGQLKELQIRFSGVIDVARELERLNEEVTGAQEEIERLRGSYSDKKEIYDRLASEIAIFDDRLALAEMGIYEPHFDFSDSEQYKRAIKQERDKQKAFVSTGSAVKCETNWSVNGSATKGQTMTNRAIKLALRAFNNECEAAIANTRWNNIQTMQQRIINAFEQINKLNESNELAINRYYLDMKITELYLTHEYREKLRAEREDRAEKARMEREAQRFLRDLERAQEDEARYAKLLAEAKAEASKIVGPQLKAFTIQISNLERELEAAKKKLERAKAMAEQTRSGYVYIISNIGSFGEGVIKIGMTRRLDPIDRVRELGDASVPFAFDTHAMIYSDDAPSLERALHVEFEHVRVNTQNTRKEFFRVTVDEVEAALQRLAPESQFIKDIEAQEYHETLARRRVALDVKTEAPSFPATL